MRFLFITLYSLGLLTLNAQQSSAVGAAETIKNQSHQSMFINGERMPYLKKCANEEDVYACTQQNFLDFLYSQLEYPETLPAYDGKYGLIMQFYIETDGRITSFQVVRNKVGAAGEKAARKLFQRLQQAPDMEWVPATSFGKKVRVQYTLPIRFQASTKLEPLPVDTIDPNKNYRCLSISKPSAKRGGKVREYIEVDEFPYLCACDSLRLQSEKKACTEEKVLAFINDHLQHPYFKVPFQPDNKVLVARFTIEPDGTIGSDIQIVRDIGPGFGKTAQYLFQKMGRTESMRWKPGQQEGKPVRVAMNIPIYYEDFLQAKNERGVMPPPPPPPPKPQVEEIFRVVEEMPRFPGCEDLPKAERKACSDQKFQEFIYRNLEYPEEARKKGKEGIAVVQFVVEKDGSTSSVEVIKNPGYGMGAAAAEVINKMQPMGLLWTAQKARGRAVRIQFHVPVRFELD
jgi:TonB family protein